MSINDKTCNSNAASGQHQAIGIIQCEKPEEFKRNSHPEAQWFGEAGLGLFLHWGISSVSGKVDISWGMMADTPWDQDKHNENKITPNEYYRLAESFNPKKYDPDKWLSAAAAAGFKYAILTTRHHDGYAMWPSKVGELGVRTCLDGRDLVRTFVDACRKNGLKVGLYYSPPDWYLNRKYMSFHYGSENQLRFPGRCHYDMDHRPIDSLPIKQKEFENEYLQYIRTQIEELLTWYGKIDVLFFDGGPNVIPFSRLRELQPGIVVNPRMHGYGDYLTPECRMPDSKPEGWWELCEIWNYGGWAYHISEQYKETSWMLSRLCHVRAWSGNYLINMAPGPDGEMPSIYYQRLSELSDWMEKYGESITGTEAGNYPEDCNIPYTKKGSSVYCFLIPSKDGLVQMKCDKLPKRITLMWTNAQAQVNFENDLLSITVLDYLRTEMVDVIKIDF